MWTEFNDLTLDFENPALGIDVVFTYPDGKVYIQCLSYGLTRDGKKYVIIGSMNSDTKRGGLGRKTFQNLKSKFDFVDSGIVYPENNEGIQFAKKMQEEGLLDTVYYHKRFE